MVDKAGLLLLLWAGATASTVVDLHKRIIGGRDCHKDERLYHVRVIAVSPKGDKSFCGGSLISDQWVITAAHCFISGWTMYAEVGVHPGPGQKVKVLENHPYSINNENHDLMLLKLDMSKLDKSFQTIDPVRKPQCHPKSITGSNGQQIQILIDPATVQIAGHAATTGGPNDERQPDSSRTLQCADIDIVDCTDLINLLKRDDPNFYQKRQHEHWLCGQSHGVDICKGDSGGGVVFNGMIYGVISFLGDVDYVCREAAGFMDLCHPDYAAWIRKTAVPDWPV